MEEDVLLDMYRHTYDDFLEAYKHKCEQSNDLVNLVSNIAELQDNDKNKQDIKDQLRIILEK